MSEKNEIWIPIYLFPQQYLGFDNVKVIDGVSLNKVGPDFHLPKILKSPVDPTFAPSHFIIIEIGKYFTALFNRLEFEGYSKSKIEEIKVKSDFTDDYLFIYPVDIAKQVLVALTLLGRQQFKVSGHYSFDFDETTQELMPGGYSPSKIEEINFSFIKSLQFNKGNPISASDLIDMVGKLDRYYRANLFQTDRISTGLSSWWDGLCSRSFSQAFLSFSTVLEALFSTTKDEITHQLAERIAAFLSYDKRDRINTYKLVKRLYTVRSFLTHGKDTTVKGSINYDITFVSAKWSNVSISRMEEMITLAQEVLYKVLNTEEILRIIQSINQPVKKNDKKPDVDLELGNLYLDLIFSTKKTPKRARKRYHVKAR